jgi:hypothetical protein
MKRIAAWICLAALALAAAPATNPSQPPANDANPRDTLPFLASDALEGRGVGLPGLDTAADFLAGEFAADGLKPLPGMTGYFQPFNYNALLSLTPRTGLTVNAQPLKLEKDFSPLGMSAVGPFSGSTVFVGYGMTDPTHHYDDYAGIDVHGKIVIAMRYEPVDANGHSRFADDPTAWSNGALLITKAEQAAKHGAVALLVVTPADHGPDDLLPFASTFAGASSAAIPMLHVSQSVVRQIFPDFDKVRADIDSTAQPHSVALPEAQISGVVDAEHKTYHLRNVMACLPGVGPNAGEYVVVGAHYDHLGRGRLGHQLGPPGSIYPGADDNASGTATVLELASQLSHGPAPARTIVFMCYSAEEEGLIGSEYFVKHPPIPLDKIIAMVNFDMVGRLRNGLLYMGGQGTAADLDGIVKSAALGTDLTLKSIGRGGLGPSDHMAFAQQHIPVLFFFSGIHADYHRPTDTYDKINYDGIEDVVDFAKKVIDGLTRMPQETYIVAADKDSFNLFGSGTNFGGPPRRVRLGVVPDYGSVDSKNGAMISGTTPDTPAAAAGLQQGDVIVQFGDKPIQNLMDLTQALDQAKPGDKVTLKFVRAGKPNSVEVTLTERKD